MKIAITIWGNRISPVFDAAKTLLVAEIGNGGILKKEYISFDPHTLPVMLEMFTTKNISTLICGAISTHPAEIIVENDIRLVSFVMGNAHEFLESFTKSNNIEESFIMPGCSVENLSEQPASGSQK